jgi:hypothetical protein
MISNVLISTSTDLINQVLLEVYGPVTADPLTSSRSWPERGLKTKYRFEKSFLVPEIIKFEIF